MDVRLSLVSLLFCVMYEPSTNEIETAATLVPYTTLCRASTTQDTWTNSTPFTSSRPCRSTSPAGQPSSPAPAAASVLPSPPASLARAPARSEEHTSELQSLMRISYAVSCLQNKRPCLAPPRLLPLDILNILMNEHID